MWDRSACALLSYCGQYRWGRLDRAGLGYVAYPIRARWPRSVCPLPRCPGPLFTRRSLKRCDRDHKTDLVGRLFAQHRPTPLHIPFVGDAQPR